jgi:histidyl-tRNA synthetase
LKKSSNRIVKPELPGGFKDFGPREALIFDSMVSRITQVYRQYGFVPIDTPCMERMSILTGNSDDFDKSIFKTRIVRGVEDRDREDSEVAEETGCRFDLTVPLARYIAANTDIPKPFKRYQLGKVFRGEKPQVGRFREFYQLDFDTIGSKSLLADVEVIQVMYDVMTALEIDEFTIRFSSRKILNGLADVLQRTQQATELFRLIDKTGDSGINAILADLTRKPDSEFDNSALELNPSEIETVREFLEIGGDVSSTLSSLEAFFKGRSAIGEAGVAEISSIAEHLLNLEIPTNCWKIDLSIARGLAYYNGPVFEAFLDALPELGSVFSGGRFDGLTNRFIEGSNISGVGASVGLSRLIVGLIALGLVEERDSLTKVLIVVFNQAKSAVSMKTAKAFREQGVNSEVYFGEDTSIRGQLAYAARKQIQYVVIIGPDEEEKGLVQLKNMDTRQQNQVSLLDAINKVKSEE